MKKIKIVKFGEFLLSRPAGREAWLAMQAYLIDNLPKDEPIEIDFAGVKILTPSWADEVITKLKEKFDNVTLINTDNSSVKASLRTIEQMPTKINNEP